METEKNLGDFALNMCYRAQEQKQSREEAQRAQESAQRPAEQAQQEVVQAQAVQSVQQGSKAQGAGSAVYQAQGMNFNEERAGSNAVTRQAKNQPAEADKKSSSAGKALLGAGALAGTALGVKALTAGNSKTASQTGSATSTKPSAQKESPKPSVQKNTSSLSAKKARPKQTKTRSSQASKAPSKQNIQVAQAVSPTGSCPVNMPSIRSAVVFQSVEAPQIESMDRQEYQKDSSNPYFTSYDLVMGKPAGVLVKLDTQNINQNGKFGVALLIAGDKSGYRQKCFHKPLNVEMVEGQERPCFFTKKDLGADVGYKFFPLPMHEKLLNLSTEEEKAVFSVKVTVYPTGFSRNKSCLQTTSFNINIIPTSDLRLGFTSINGDKCTYSSVESEIVEGFVESDEVQERIQSMFPVKHVSSEMLEYVLSGRRLDYIEGVCDNSNSLKISPSKYNHQTVGMLADIDWAEQIRAKFSYSKLLLIVDDSYFRFHKKVARRDTLAGIVISPHWESTEYKGFWKIFGITPFQLKSEGENLGGSWNIAFINSNQKNNGTVSHELAHTLGQDADYYDLSLGYKCRHFNGEVSKVCKDKKVIPRALHTGVENNKSFWEFVEDKYALMDNQNGISAQWLNRDTYQKMFWVLSKLGDGIPEWIDLWEEVNTSRLKGKKSSLKAVVSGFYHQKQDAFVVPKTRVYKTKLKTLSFHPKKENPQFPVLTFQLKEKKETLVEIKRVAFKMKMELLYKDKNSVTEPFPFSYTMAAFPLPLDYKKRNLQLVVLGPGKNVIYKASLLKKRKKKDKTESVALIDNK